jgi:hypothetical protein
MSPCVESETETDEGGEGGGGVVSTASFALVAEKSDVQDELWKGVCLLPLRGDGGLD